MASIDQHRIVLAQPPGGPEVLKLEAEPLRALEKDEILIRTASCGINRPDQFERLGFYPAPAGAAPGLGLEAAGEIAACGTEVAAFSPGDRVMALVSGGGYSDYVIAKAGATLAVPDAVALADAGGLPETVFTVWANVFDTVGLLQGETLLVHGGASGIGTTAIQMAAAAGARVIATAGSDARCDLCRELGADLAINYKSADFEDAVRAAGGADVVLDMVGGDYVQKNINIARHGARIVSIAFLKGSQVQLDLMRVMLKQITLTGSTLRARPDAEKARLADGIRATVLPWIAAGQVKPVIDSRFALDDVISAHKRLDGGEHAGKILLTP